MLADGQFDDVHASLQGRHVDVGYGIGGGCQVGDKLPRCRVYACGIFLVFPKVFHHQADMAAGLNGDVERGFQAARIAVGIPPRSLLYRNTHGNAVARRVVCERTCILRR